MIHNFDPQSETEQSADCDVIVQTFRYKLVLHLKTLKTFIQLQ